MGKLGWFAVGAFVAALVAPCFWLPFLALLIAIVIKRVNPPKQGQSLPIRAKYGDLDGSDSNEVYRATVTSDREIRDAIAEAESQGAQVSEKAKALIDVFLRSRQIMEESLEIARNTKNEITRSSRLEQVRLNLERIEDLERKYDLPCRLSEPEKIWAEYYQLSGGSLEEEYQDKAPDLSAFIGKPWGEVVAEMTGGANLVDGKQTWELAEGFKHDLPKMLQCCHAELKTMEQAGQIPAPYYFERAAILFRKLKQYNNEVKIVELYLSAVDAWNAANNNARPDGPGARHAKIVARLPKARQLAEKHSEKSKLEPT